MLWYVMAHHNMFDTHVVSDMTCHNMSNITHVMICHDISYHVWHACCEWYDMSQHVWQSMNQTSFSHGVFHCSHTLRSYRVFFPLFYFFFSNACYGLSASQSVLNVLYIVFFCNQHVCWLYWSPKFIWTQKFLYLM